MAHPVTEQPASWKRPWHVLASVRVPTVVWVILGELLFFGLLTRDFAQPANLISIVVQASPLVILSLGAAIILLSGGLDLSSGLLFTLCMGVGAVLLQRGVAWPLALLAAISVGLVGGGLNALLVAFIGIPPFLATLATQGISWGIGLGITERGSVAISEGPTYWFGEGVIAGIPVPVLIALLVFFLCHLLLYRTPFGTYLYAIGSNQEAASLAGLNVRKWKSYFYLLAGLLAGITGVVLLGRMHSAHPNVGQGWEFDAIAAAVIGGISASSGGRGRLRAAVLGALFIAILRNGLNFLGMPTYWQTFTKGFVIVGAIVLDILVERRRRVITWRRAVRAQIQEA